MVQIRNFRASNQQSNEIRDRPEDHDFNITHLRLDAELRGQVEAGISVIRSRVPSLAAPPTAQVQNNGTKRSTPAYFDQTDESVERYEWVTDSRGGRHLVPISDSNIPNKEKIGSASARPNDDYYSSRHEMSSHTAYQYIQETNSDQYSWEYRCSPQSGRVFQVRVPVKKSSNLKAPTPQQLYRLEYRCSPSTGRVWQEHIPVNTPSPRRQTYHLEWRVHPLTGETYQVEVPSAESFHSQEPRQLSGDTPYKVTTSPGHRLYTSNAPHNQVQKNTEQPPVQQRDSVAGIYRLDKNPTKKQSRVVDHAKLCPVKWAKNISSNNINLPLYIWGAIAELESSLSGRSTPMPDGELLGKMRHLKNIVEVCCLNSTSADFSTYGWAIAKDYALKVEDEVAQNLVNWGDMQHGVRTSSLVLAQMDCPRQSFIKNNKTKDSEKDKIVCTTYNKCTTKGKCEYEVMHPDKTCQRKHECSWCKSNLNQSYKHQVWDCNKKKDASGSD